MATKQTKPVELANGSAHRLIDSDPVTPESLLRGVNELAGMSQQEPGTIPEDSGPLFLAPWEATVFAIVVSLHQQGYFSWSEWVEFFKTEIERATAAGKQTHGSAYYSLWLSAAEKLLLAKGLLLEDEYARVRSAFALEHPHACIQGLMQEHKVINKALDSFACFVERLENDAGTSAELLLFVDFFTAFVERLHDNKEEKLLFQAMTDNGFPEDGPLAVMCEEHVQGAHYLSELSTAALTRWGQHDRVGAARVAMQYIQLLRQHVSKEDAELYPSAHARLGEEILTELDRVCAEYDDTHMAERSRLLELANDLNRQ